MAPAGEVRTRIIARRLLVAACALLVGGCASPSSPPGPPPGQVAPALRGVVPLLRGVRIPVYLPTRLPPMPVPGAYYYAAVQRSSDSYDLTIGVTPHPVPVNGPATLSMSTTLGWITGGPPGSTGADAVALSHFSGSPRHVALGSGLTGDFYLNQGVTWRQGGWRYAVRDDTGKPATVVPLLPAVRRIEAAVPAWGNPVARGTRGWFVQSFAPDGADYRILWTARDAAYYVDGHGISGITLARSLVRVKV